MPPAIWAQTIKVAVSRSMVGHPEGMLTSATCFDTLRVPPDVGDEGVFAARVELALEGDLTELGRL